MADPLTLSLVVPAAAAAAFALTRHGRRRRRTCRALAEHREALITGCEPRLAGRPDPAALRAGFERDRILRVEALLAPESLAELRQECEANRSTAERSYIPGHKKGGTLSYEAIHRGAPACLAFYRRRDTSASEPRDRLLFNPPGPAPGPRCHGSCRLIASAAGWASLRRLPLHARRRLGLSQAGWHGPLDSAGNPTADPRRWYVARGGARGLGDRVGPRLPGCRRHGNGLRDARVGPFGARGADRSPPDREYWYRFHAGEATSPIGRTRTAPAADAAPGHLRLGVGSCQHYEKGWFVAYRHIAADALDLFLHLGDYIYEGSARPAGVRSHGAPEPHTLEDYRRHFALYKSDPDLQSAHASCPWLVVWDDHELENDYAGDRSENDDEPAWFLQRRAAAYKAYYEHMPLPRAMVPFGPHLRLHTRVGYGQLANIHMLDNRQYRTPQPCPRPGRGGSNFIEDCPDRLNPQASMLGARQEAWLKAGLDASKARWNLLGQQTLMAQADGRAGPGEVFFSDGWDGYPAARRRLLEHLSERRPGNPVVLGGDLHSFWVSDLKPDFNDAGSPVVASEFVATSITSGPPPEERIQTAVSEGPHIRFATGVRRGYLRLDLTPQRLTADLRGVASVLDPDSGCETLASFVVEDGRPGPQSA